MIFFIRRFSLFLFIHLFVFFPSLAHAKLFKINQYHTHGPVGVRTQHPLYLLFVSSPLESTQVLAPKTWKVSLSNSFTNLFERKISPAGVSLDLDMELVRTAFMVQYGIHPRIEAAIELPFLSFFGGFMDEFIQDFHQAFGFPNDGRANVSHGRFSYQITQNGNTLYTVNPATMRLSDLPLSIKFKLFDETTKMPSIALKSILKLPTGSVDAGTGSGRPDFAFSILAQKSWKRLQSYTQAGFSALGGHSRLDPILKKGGGHFSQAFEYNLWDPVSVIAQLHYQSSYFKNVSVSHLKESIIDMTIGFTGWIPLGKKDKKIYYQVGFTEDPTGSGPAVDFTAFAKFSFEWTM